MAENDPEKKKTLSWKNEATGNPNNLKITKTYIPGLEKPTAGSYGILRYRDESNGSPRRELVECLGRAQNNPLLYEFLVIPLKNKIIKLKAIEFGTEWNFYEDPSIGILVAAAARNSGENLRRRRSRKLRRRRRSTRRSH
jgi:hypothetical protein